MKQWVVAVALCLGALLVAGVVVTTTAQDDDADDALTTVATRDDDAEPPRHRRGTEGRSDRYGPPPWVRGGPSPWAGWPGESWKAGKPSKPSKPSKPGKPSKQWHRQWRGLSEAERDDVMADLARKHAAGMRRWSDCVKESDDRSDRTDRTDCERPLPPGQAKKVRGG